MESQHTIGKQITLEGRGLQTGKPVRAEFFPAGENEGISFRRSDLKNKPPIRLRDYSALCLRADRRSIVNLDAENFVETTEHVLAAAWGAGIDNLNIELNSSEMPAMDGSARAFLKAFKDTGVKTQSAERKFIEIKEPIWTEEKESFLGIFPSGAFKISCIFEHPYLTKERQSFSEVVTADLFQKELASARTLWFVSPGPGSIEQKAEYVKKAGYGRGADTENTLIIDEKKTVNSARFPDEPVRHGVLDLIGDLYLLSKPVKGRLIAIRSGHKLNLELVAKIKEKLCR